MNCMLIKYVAMYPSFRVVLGPPTPPRPRLRWAFINDYYQIIYSYNNRQSTNCCICPPPPSIFGSPYFPLPPDFFRKNPCTLVVLYAIYIIREILFQASTHITIWLKMQLFPLLGQVRIIAISIPREVVKSRIQVP